MKFLYNFGLSQDDAATEMKALNLRSGDHLLCIASAGEVPLNLLATADVQIDAVDIAPEQLRLSRLKFSAALQLEPLEAACFLGYWPCEAQKRRLYFQHVEQSLPPDDQSFWQQHPEIFHKGAVHLGRFERYLSRFSSVGLRILNKKKVLGLFECDDLLQQQRYFDRYLDTRKLQFLFNIAFHPKIYRKRGMDQAALVHSRKRNIAQFFFSKFRDFCTATIARQNYFLQFMLFNRVLFPEALPEYLKEAGNQKLRSRRKKLVFFQESCSERLQNQPAGYYNKFALSNVGDWLTTEAFASLMELLVERAHKPSRALLRYIHFAHPLPESLQSTVQLEPNLGKQLEKTDRFPFYNLIPMTIAGKVNHAQ